ncbi:hypothetical protein LIER_43275 [Lithospermum erythrorhizon]|uniref:Uncharacterized protein n=1 Tax=Lithospermum erythrorhizon TaxID=34254 RepID=A0AAV3PUH9_LITER
MADNSPQDAAGFTNTTPGTIRRILEEVSLACLAASVGGSYLLEGKILFSPSTSPLIHYPNNKIVVVPDPSNVDTGTQESGTGHRSAPPSDGRDNEEAEIFAASVITDPNVDVKGRMRGSGNCSTVQKKKYSDHQENVWENRCPRYWR